MGIHSDGAQQKPWKPRPNLTLGGLVRDFRQTHNLLHAQIAEDWGVSKMHIWKIERGKCMPSRALAIIISRWMGVDENLILIMAGYFPWEVGIEHARKVSEIVTGVLPPRPRSIGNPVEETSRDTMGAHRVHL